MRMALAQANNHLERSDDLIQKDAVEKVEKLVNLIKRNSRINIVLQFFARPEFEKILHVMKGDKKKAGKFVEWVIHQNEDNLTLAKLIARYKDYAVTLLSGEYALLKQEKMEHSELKFEEPLAIEQQRKLRSEVEGNYNR